MWRTDGGPDQTLYATTLGISDAGSDAGEPTIQFGQALAAIPAHCGDLLVLQVTLLADGGFIGLAFPTMSIP